MEGQSDNSHHYVGHTHFWERAGTVAASGLSGRRGATGVVLASGLWMPIRAG